MCLKGEKGDTVLEYRTTRWMRRLLRYADGNGRERTLMVIQHSHVVGWIYIYRGMENVYWSHRFVVCTCRSPACTQRHTQGDMRVDAAVLFTHLPLPSNRVYRPTSNSVSVSQCVRPAATMSRAGRGSATWEGRGSKGQLRQGSWITFGDWASPRTDNEMSWLGLVKRLERWRDLHRWRLISTYVT